MYVFTLDVSFDHQTLERAAKLDEKAGIKQKQQQKTGTVKDGRLELMYLAQDVRLELMYAV